MHAKRKAAQVPGGSAPIPSVATTTSVAEATMVALMKADLDSANKSVPAATSVGAGRFNDMRAHVKATFGDNDISRELLAILDILEAFDVHLSSLVSDFDTGFGHVIDAAEPLSRRLSLHSSALTQSETKLEEIGRLLAIATGNQERLLARLCSTGRCVRGAPRRAARPGRAADDAAGDLHLGWRGPLLLSPMNALTLLNLLPITLWILAVTASMFDLRTQRIPDSLNYAGIASGLEGGRIGAGVPDRSRRRRPARIWRAGSLIDSIRRSLSQS